jgi:hemoglobin
MTAGHKELSLFMVDNYFALLGEAKLAELVASFYQRVRTDDLLGPLYPPDDLEASEKRLRDFLIYRFGGPPRYLEERGHPRLRARHFPFSIGIAERDRWLSLMEDAMNETKLPEDVCVTLREFFGQVADAMRNRPETEPG